MKNDFNITCYNMLKHVKYKIWPTKTLNLKFLEENYDFYGMPPEGFPKGWIIGFVQF